jgi:hypothetical protein
MNIHFTDKRGRLEIIINMQFREVGWWDELWAMSSEGLISAVVNLKS